jgi:hypothetical protein
VVGEFNCLTVLSLGTQNTNIDGGKSPEIGFLSLGALDHNLIGILSGEIENSIGELLIEGGEGSKRLESIINDGFMGSTILGDQMLTPLVLGYFVAEFGVELEVLIESGLGNR